MANNVWSDVSSIANTIQSDAIFVVRATMVVGGLAPGQGLCTVFNDATGMNTRTGYKYNQGTARAIGDDDDLTSDAFTPSADQTLTPSEIGLQFFVSDARAESEVPESIIVDASRELGLAATDKIETDMVGLFPSSTGGTVGGTATAITWGYLAAAIAQARYANKSNSIPLDAVIHAYQWAVLAGSASIAGATTSPAPAFSEEVTRNGWVAQFMGVNLHQTMEATTGGAFKGAVFPREAYALDWRRSIRVEPQRDASRRGWEFNMSAIYAKGVWRPDRAILLQCLAATPSS